MIMQPILRYHNNLKNRKQLNKQANLVPKTDAKWESKAFICVSADVLSCAKISVICPS